MDTNTTEAPQWAVIELMGHVRYGGQVSKDNQFGTAMLRVDVPQPDGSFVSQLINPSSIYRITMCSEAIGRAAAKQGAPSPLSQWELRHLLPQSETSGTTMEEIIRQNEAENYDGFPDEDETSV